MDCVTSMVNVAPVVEDKSWSGNGMCKLVAIVVEDCCWVERYLKAQLFALSVELLSKSGMRAPIMQISCMERVIGYYWGLVSCDC